MLNSKILKKIVGIAMRNSIHLLMIGILILGTINIFGQWTAQNTGISENLNAVYFLNKDKGWAVGNSGAIIKTTDGGNTWIKQNSGVTSKLTCINFLNDTSGVAGGENGKLLYTYDGGNNWKATPIKDTISGKIVYPTINKVTVYDSSFIFVGTNGLFRMYYKGIGWKDINFDYWRLVNHDYKVENFKFFNDSSGIAVVDYYDSSLSKLFLKTNNGGKNWEYINHLTFTTSYYNNSFILSQDSIFVTGKTSRYSVAEFTIVNSGGSNLTWRSPFDTTSSPNLPYYINMDKPFFVSAKNGWAIAAKWGGGSSVILKTNDGGYSWSKVNSGINTYQLNDIFFLDENHGWAVGDSGKVYVTDNGGGQITSVNDNNKNILPGDFSLYQNYPNPFNPTTTIRYSMPAAGNVNLSIYNMLGQKVTTLVNNRESSGYHSVQFNSDGIASGVYMYVLKIGKKYTSFKEDDPS